MISQIYQICERNDSGVEVIHLITMEDHKLGGWYRQVSSAEAFTQRIVKRWFHHWNKKKNYFSRVKFGRWDNSETEMYNEVSKAFPNGRPDLKFVKWNSIWDFYDSINYNHKNRSVKEIDKFIIIKEL